MGTETVARPWDGVVIGFVPAFTPSCGGSQEPTGATYDQDAPAREYQKRVCVGCPVFTQCATHALNHEPYGLWALTDAQRWNLGGVVPEEWSDMIPNPAAAITELIDAGLTIDRIWDLIEAAALDTEVNLEAVAAWESPIFALMAA